ncbi:hypothetical protein [Companilactobacillus musae]|uniref:hypothetical protein n=1 Tax=Companilactobacillus musae TaxID=1903258 RepID=UPI000E65ADB4|nr:hypothetical protein [Companilactobacillus musae]
METGSLAEWVEGLGELLAVSVALFLPYYQQRKNNRERNQRAKQVIVSTTTSLLNQSQIQSAITFEELQKFISIYAVLSTNSKTIEIIDIGDEILEIIGDQNQLNDLQKGQLQQLIAKLKNLKS